VNGPRLVPAAAIAARGRRLLFHCHSYLAPKYLEWSTAIPLRMAKAHVVASSNFVARPLRGWIPTTRLQVVYNGVRDGEQKRARGERVRVGVIGRIAPEKGQDVFLRAARGISACDFVVCGAPLFSDGAYERQVRAIGEGLPVEFTGWREDVDQVLASLDLLVVPSAPIDATPRIILQAFAAKVPVVAFANEGFRELIEDGRTGFLVASRTAEALAERIRHLLAHQDTLDAVAEAARCDWQKRFSLEAYQRALIGILERMT
jgi:glycosyltransferase involved in cell wall biosynthesis